MKHTARSLLLLVCSLSALTACGGGTTDTPDANAPVDGGTVLPCAPGASCELVGDCLAEVDQTGVSEPTLRIAQLTIARPTALGSGIVGSVVGGAFLPNEAECNLAGTATANWILQITDGGSGLRIGAARPRASGAYTLIDETLGGVAIAPATTTLSGSSELESGAVDVVLPVFLDAEATTSILFPVHSLRVSMTPDASRTCVGRYDAAGLDPENACQPDSETPAFVEGGTLEGFVLLEDADTVEITSIAQSLCVILSGDPIAYSDGATPVAHCKRTGGVIDFHGDWCSTTDAAATVDCFDAVRFSAGFAASGVEL